MVYLALGTAFIMGCMLGSVVAFMIAENRRIKDCEFCMRLMKSNCIACRTNME
jgi:hypothetical protein